jgi:hypothetical protein
MREMEKKNVMEKYRTIGEVSGGWVEMEICALDGQTTEKRSIWLRLFSLTARQGPRQGQRPAPLSGAA